MAFLSEQELADIRQAIETVEKKTRGELVTVITRQSDDYLYIPTLWAALIALAMPGLVSLLNYPVLEDYGTMLQFSVFVVLALIFQWSPLKFRLIPRQVKLSRAHRMAQEQFLLRNLHHTAERTGVLIFVSVAEHYVEILADKGINDAVEKNTWDVVVQAFLQSVKQGQVAKGFIDTIEHCGDLLAEKFPLDESNDSGNELPNHLVQL